MTPKCPKVVFSCFFWVDVIDKETLPIRAGGFEDWYPGQVKLCKMIHIEGPEVRIVSGFTSLLDVLHPVVN